MSTGQINSHGKTIALIGAFLQACPILGLIYWVASPVMAVLGMSRIGVAGDPKAFSATVRFADIVVICGSAAGVIGLALLIVALYGYRYRAPWLFWFLVIYGGVMLFAPPIATVIGIVLLIMGFTCKDELLGRDRPDSFA